MTTGRRIDLAVRAMASCLALTFLVSPVRAGDLGDYFEDFSDSARNSGLKVSVDSLFMFRTDDMNSLLMSNSGTGATAFQTGQTNLGTNFGPMVNITQDSNSGWGAGFRYYSLIDGSDTSNQFAPDFESFREHFNGVDFGDLIQFDTNYSSTLHNFEFNLRKTIRPGLTVYAGYRFLELDERFSIRARNSLPQEPAIEISNSSLSNQLHGAQIGTQISLFQRANFTLDAGASTGIYNNFAHQTMFVRDNGTDLETRSVHDSQLALVNDLNLTGAYRLSNRWSVRAGLQMLWLTDVALAPEQTQTNDFRTQTFAVDNSSDIFYFGGFTGLQYEF